MMGQLAPFPCPVVAAPQCNALDGVDVGHVVFLCDLADGLGKVLFHGFRQY